MRIPSLSYIFESNHPIGPFPSDFKLLKDSPTLKTLSLYHTLLSNYNLLFLTIILTTYLKSLSPFFVSHFFNPTHCNLGSISATPLKQLSAPHIITPVRGGNNGIYYMGLSLVLTMLITIYVKSLEQCMTHSKCSIIVRWLVFISILLFISIISELLLLNPMGMLQCYLTSFSCVDHLFLLEIPSASMMPDSLSFPPTSLYYLLGQLCLCYLSLP